MDAGKHGDNIRAQQVKGVFLINFGNPEGKILLFDLHVVIEHNGKLRPQIFPGPADAQIVAPGKAGVLAVNQHGDIRVVPVLFLQSPAGIIGGGVVHNDDVIFALELFDAFRAGDGAVNGAVMEDHESVHISLSSFFLPERNALALSPR